MFVLVILCTENWNRFSTFIFVYINRKIQYVSKAILLKSICSSSSLSIESMGMEHDWGYSTRHYYSLKHSYGAPEDLKRFIDECHGRQIRVILDGVYTFTNTECPLLQIDRDYWVKEFYTTEKCRNKTKNIRSLMLALQKTSTLSFDKSDSVWLWMTSVSSVSNLYNGKF